MPRQTMYASKDRLIILDADGTIIDAFSTLEAAFAQHGMKLGDLDRFQKRHNVFKYLGGIKEFPGNVAKHLGKGGRKALLDTLTAAYRESATMFPGTPELIRDLVSSRGGRVGLVTRNITHEPAVTLGQLFRRHDIDITSLDFVHYLSLKQEKSDFFQSSLTESGLNPGRAHACGDEHRDYRAAMLAGMSPLIASYGFESRQRLTEKFAIPAAVIADTPDELCARIRHTFDLPEIAAG